MSEPFRAVFEGGRLKMNTPEGSRLKSTPVNFLGPNTTCAAEKRISGSCRARLSPPPGPAVPSKRPLPDPGNTRHPARNRHFARKASWAILLARGFIMVTAISLASPYAIGGLMSHKTAPSKQRVLVVDDHGISRRFTVAALRQNNCAVKAAAGVSESIDKACAWLPEVIFTDWRLADGLGKDVLRGVRNRWPSDRALPRFVLVTGDPPCSPGLATAFDRILIKPCSAATLAGETRTGIPPVCRGSR